MSGERPRAERIWKTALVVACLCATVAASPAAAKPKNGAGKKGLAGRLDLSFGKGGKMTVAFPTEEAGNVGVKYDLPFQFTAGHLEMAPAPGGRIVVAGSTKLVRFLPNGKLDPGFGTGGSVAIERPPGQSFVLADVAVDSKGRILVAGSARPQPSSSTPDPLVSSMMIMRFATDGSPDGSFAKEGRLISDLGIEPPKIGSSRYTGAAVGLRSLAIDSRNRPVLTGGSVSEVVRCGPSEEAVSTAFVVRLTESGALDPSFGDAGLRQIVDFSSFAQGSFLPIGTLLTVASSKFSCERSSGPAAALTSFGSDGNLDPDFGFAGFRSVGFSRVPVTTVAPSGKIVLLGTRQGGKQKSQLVMRLLSDGGIDPSFGRIGRVRMLLPKGAAFGAVAVDGRGRLLFAGRASKRVSKSDRNPLRRSTFLLSRMNPKGGFDRSFGKQGSVRTGFGGPSSAVATQVMLGAQGRIVVGGNISTPRLITGGGFALARYLSGR